MYSQQQLIETAKKRNYRLSYSTIDSFPAIGINKGRGVWHWFFALTGGSVFFDHSYSTNNGSTKRGVTHAMKIEQSLGLL